MAVQRRVYTFRNDPNLAPFVVEGTADGKLLGTGSYGSVEEVVINGLTCAGKKIHEALVDAGNIGVQQIARKYVEECQLMSSLRHPNITLFLGLLFIPNSQLPMLIMEKLDGSLDDLLETVANVPLTLKRSILEDVAQGILYLHKHNPQVVHRDLTAKNVLLTASVYGPSLDTFSFGVLALFTITQIFPGELLEPNYADVNNVETLIPRTEFERRGRFLEPLERENHCCLQLIKDCLHNSPSRRPTAEQIVTALEGIKEHVDGPFGDIARADAVRQVVTMKTLSQTRTVIQEQVGDLAARDEEIRQLRHQLEEAERRHQLEIQQMVAEHEHGVTEMQEHLIHLQDVERRHQLEMQQKDLEHEQRIVALQEQLRWFQISQEGHVGVDRENQQQLSRVQDGLSEPALPLNIQWKRVADMPQAMSYYPEAVVVGTKVYVGAGSGECRESVMEYNITGDKWSVLPDYDYFWFGMTSARNKLVLVGGVKGSIGGTRTNQLAVWDENGCIWSRDMPAMPTARSGPSVVTYKDRWMVVTGGFDTTHGYRSTVEILDITTSYWHLATSLPVRQFKMSPTIIGSTLYLLAGYCVPLTGEHVKGLYVCIDDLIYQAVFPSRSPVHWQNLPDIPASVTSYTALGFNGALLAVGPSSIHVYKSSTNGWVQAGELPRTR